MKAGCVVNWNRRSVKAHGVAVRNGFWKTGGLDKQYSQCVSEIMEHFEAFRLGRFADTMKTGVAFLKLKGLGGCVLKDDFRKFYEDHLDQTHESEIADAVIVLISIGHYLGVDFKIMQNIVVDQNYIDGSEFGDYMRLVSLVTGVWSQSGFKDESRLQLCVCLKHIFRYCDLKKINIERHVDLKIAYNGMREHLNGKNH